MPLCRHPIHAMRALWLSSRPSILLSLSYKRALDKLLQDGTMITAAGSSLEATSRGPESSSSGKAYHSVGGAAAEDYSLVSPEVEARLSAPGVAPPFHKHAHGMPQDWNEA